MGWTQSDPEEENQEIQPPQIVPGFHLLRRVGEGSFGTVYQAKDLSNGEVVAVKTMKLCNDVAGLPLPSLREVEILQDCQNLPSVVQLKEVVTSDDFISIVMDYLESNLKARLKTAPETFHEDTIRHIMREVLKGVVELHRFGIVHRDIKPDNILISEDGRKVKICDVGLADRITPDAKFPRMEKPIGTRSFIAPEILRREEYAKAVDIWSCGCVMADMLRNGKHLFPGPDVDDQIAQIYYFSRHGIFRGLRRKIPPTKLSHTGFEFLSKLLETDPSKRITAHEAINHPWLSVRFHKPIRPQKPTRPPWRL